MRSFRAFHLAVLGAFLLAPCVARAQTYRATLRCESGFVGVAITGLDFWCSDAPCANVAPCGPHGGFACPGLTLSVGGGNLSCSNVLDPDQMRDFVMAPCNNSVCNITGITTLCRRWVRIYYVCSTTPTVVRTVCMRVPGSVGLTCPPASAFGIDAAAGDPVVATCSMQRVSRETQVPTDCLPPPRTYAGEFHALYAAGLVDLRDPIHSGFTSCEPPPPPVPGATTYETFSSVVDATVSISGGPPTPVTAPATCTVAVTFAGMVGDTQLFDTEMLALDIAGGTLPPGFLIRESPTYASPGATTIRPAPDGGFRMTSFFDVFTELSMDGGLTWYPSTDEFGVLYAGTMVLQHDPGNPSDVAPSPRITMLHPNVPNPFNPSTEISFDLAHSAHVRLEILNVAGDRLRQLVSTSMLAGRHAVIWNGLDDAGNAVGSGIYIYRLVAGEFEGSRKLVLVR